MLTIIRQTVDAAQRLREKTRKYLSRGDFDDGPGRENSSPVTYYVGGQDNADYGGKAQDFGWLVRARADFFLADGLAAPVASRLRVEAPGIDDTAS